MGMQEYRKCVADWKLGVVTALFDTLNAMCNLLILPPENLRGAAMGDQLASVDKELQEKAREKVVWDTPADSARIRPVFRCTVTGRGGGIYDDFRVSRFVFRGEA